MNSKSIAFLFLGIIFVLAGVFNILLEHAPSINIGAPSSSSLSGLFSKLTGMMTYFSNPSTSYIEANLTASMQTPQEFDVKSSTSLSVLLGREAGNVEVGQMFGNAFQLELVPFSQLVLEGYAGTVTVSDTLELVGTATRITSTTASIKSKKNPMKLETYSLPYTYISMDNVTITNLNLQNVKGTLTLVWGKDSIIHRIVEPRTLRLDSFQGELIINGTRILLKGKATYRPNLLILPAL